MSDETCFACSQPAITEIKDHDGVVKPVCPMHEQMVRDER